MKIKLSGEKLDFNVSEICDQVEKILDIAVTDREECNIVALKDDNDFQRETSAIFGLNIGKVGGVYVHATGTIYIDKSTATKYLIGHELAHALLMRYFLTPVSEVIMEVLAGYVEYKMRQANGN